MSARAGIVVTGTEVLTGRVTDRNGPWLAERLRELGVDIAHNDRRGRPAADLRDALGWLRVGRDGPDHHQRWAGPDRGRPDRRGGRGVPGPAVVVGRGAGGPHLGDPRAPDGALARPGPGRDPALEREAGDGAGGRDGAGAGRARRRGWSCRRAPGRPGRRSSSCPGRRASCSRCGRWRSRPSAFRAAIAGAVEYRQDMLRLFGIPESEIANTMLKAREAGIDLDALEITTCLRRGEVEVVTRFEPPQQARLRRLRGADRRAPSARAVLDRRHVGRPAGRGAPAGRRAGRSRPPSPAPAACWPAG